MQFSHTPGALSAVFDDENLASHTGVVPAMRLAERAGLRELAARTLTIPTDKGANPGGKVCSLVAGMLAGADSIDDINILRHGGMGKLAAHTYAPSTLGSFLRKFTFGHVRQLDAIAARFLQHLAVQVPRLLTPVTGERVVVDIDDSIAPVYGYQKQGAGYGYTGVRGLNWLLVTVSCSSGAPVILGQRLRKGGTHSVRGADKLVADSLTALSRMSDAPVLLRADSAYYGHDVIHTARRHGADVSITVPMNASIRRAIEHIPETAWQSITYPNTIIDEDTGQLIRGAEVAEIPYTAFASRKPARASTGQAGSHTGPVQGRLVVRRVRELSPTHGDHPTLFDVWRFHGFFTTVSPAEADTVTADRVHRRHAIIEQVHADLKGTMLAHLPSGKFPANSAWLVLAVIAWNLLRAVGVIAGGSLARATAQTIRARLIQVAARVSSSARRLVVHLPAGWKWEAGWMRVFHHGLAPPGTRVSV